MITSLQNSQIKATVRLRDRRHRTKQGRFLIDGAREIDRALRGRFALERVYYCTECDVRRSDDIDLSDLLERLRSSCVELSEVTPAVFEKISFGHRREGLVAVAPTAKRSLQEYQPTENPFLAVIEQVEKPGNLGAILRTADAAGVDAVIVVDPRTDLFNPNAIRASLGTIFTVPLFETTFDEATAWLKKHQINSFAARVDSSVPYTEVDYTPATAVVLGSEAEGLTDRWDDTNSRAIRLPMQGIADSLNLSVSAAVLFYEALRQRQSK